MNTIFEISGRDFVLYIHRRELVLLNTNVSVKILLTVRVTVGRFIVRQKRTCTFWNHWGRFAPKKWNYIKICPQLKNSWRTYIHMYILHWYPVKPAHLCAQEQFRCPVPKRDHDGRVGFQWGPILASQAEIDNLKKSSTSITLIVADCICYLQDALVAKEQVAYIK